MHDQAQELRQLMQGASTPEASSVATTRLLVVAGGKGGVGATTLAVLLGHALSTSGERVVLIDAEGGNGNLAMYCGIIPTLTTAEVLASRTDLLDALQPGPNGMLVLPGDWSKSTPDGNLPGAPSISSDTRAQFANNIQRLGSITDYVIVDVGAGSGAVRWVDLWNAADAGIVTTTPDAVSIMDAYSLIKQLVVGGVRSDFDVIPNQVSGTVAVADVQRRLAESCRRFLGIKLRLPGAIPLDTVLLQDSVQSLALNLNCESPAMTAIQRIGSRLAGELQANH